MSDVGIRLRVTEVELVDNLYLFGAPGIGKTEVIRQKAKEEAKKLGRVFVDLRTWRGADDKTPIKIDDIFNDPSKYYVFLRVPAPHIMPEDFAIPAKNPDPNARYYEQVPPKAFRVMSLPGIAGVLFLDELNNVHRNDQITALFALLQEKDIGWSDKLSPDIKVVAAGNPPEMSSVANPLPLPMRGGRLIVVWVDPPTVDEWIEYMVKTYKDAWDVRTAAYLKIYPNDLFRPPVEDDGVSPYPTPRSWTRLALELYRFRDNEKFSIAMAYGLLGKEVGQRFEAVIRAHLTPQELDNLERHPAQFDDLEEAKKIFVITAVANNPRKYARLLRHIASKNRDYFVLSLVMMKPSDRMWAVNELKDKVAEMAEAIASYM